MGTMAARKKGSRRIVVEGVEYLWRVPRRPSSGAWDGTSGFTVTVQLSQGSGSVLALFSQTKHPTLERIWCTPTHSILPSHIAASIRQALEAGWKPSESKGSFGLALATPDKPNA